MWMLVDLPTPLHAHFLTNMTVRNLVLVIVTSDQNKEETLQKPMSNLLSWGSLVRKARELKWREALHANRAKQWLGAAAEPASDWWGAPLGLRATWSNGRCPWPCQGGWNWMFFKVTVNPTCSVIQRPTCLPSRFWSLCTAHAGTRVCSLLVSTDWSI